MAAARNTPAARDTILVVDDDDGIRQQLRWALKDSYKVIDVGTPDEALAACKSARPDLIALDVGLSEREGDPGGLDLLPQLLAASPGCRVIMVTGDAQRSTALRAVELGASDYYVKPIDLDELTIIVRRNLHVAKLERENAELRSQLTRSAAVDEMIGESPAMTKVFGLISTVAPSDYTVLITGASGTGKELVARAIHRQSGRRNRPFVVINCGAIPSELLESELFGHEPGSFTGATGRKLGRFEVANEGTLFLDEIGELSPKLQVKLLRVLQDHNIERVGGTSPIELDVRVLAATNRNLEDEVRERRFREDLFYRLSVIAIHMPDLKDRGDDLFLLGRHFLSRFTTENDKGNLTLAPETVEAMSAHAWEGNIRELENRLRRAAILSTGSTVTPADLGLTAAKPPPLESPMKLAAAREQAERRCIAQAMAGASGNISQAAKMLGVSRTTLYYLLEKTGMPRPDKD